MMSEENKVYSTALTKISNTYAPMIESQLVGNGIKMDDYSKQCVMSAISAINNVLTAKNISWSDPQLDQSNVTQNLLTIASLQLNAAANPREVYFQIRSVNTNRKGDDGKYIWKKQIEMGIEGDGNDAILSRFGRDVKEVKQFWEVRENDKFSYPEFNGIELTPPKWSPTGQGKVIKVVYPIVRENDSVDYHIAERADVVRNLIAHIKNNLMNETFGIAKSRFDADYKQKKEIDEKKQEIIQKAAGKDLDAILDDTGLQEYISPAWKDPQSRESMIIRKMRNNITKKIPKDFGNAFLQLQYSEQDDSYQRVRKEIVENANQEIIDVEYESVEYDPVVTEGKIIENDLVAKEVAKEVPTGTAPIEPVIQQETSTEQVIDKSVDPFR
ncbi:hypothetical protein HB815_01060 [Listeria booriae]|uniref:hypothetical protein n=1 Tax=Listeria booriae TaxID=1552123 RepID=UPI00162996CF|nr:hypothetical protein [Listeria booriae]MBC1209505.1 hypothetical protein [Listeria booriae]